MLSVLPDYIAKEMLKDITAENPGEQINLQFHKIYIRKHDDVR